MIFRYRGPRDRLSIAGHMLRRGEEVEVTGAAAQRIARHPHVDRLDTPAKAATSEPEPEPEPDPDPPDPTADINLDDQVVDDPKES